MKEGHFQYSNVQMKSADYNMMYFLLFYFFKTTYANRKAPLKDKL